VLLGRRVVDCRFELRGDLWRVDLAQRNGRFGRISRRACDLIDAHPGTGGADRTASFPTRRGAKAASALLRYARISSRLGLIVHDRGRFSDNWIYIHDPACRSGACKIYKSWSPEMVPRSRLLLVWAGIFCLKGTDCGRDQ